MKRASCLAALLLVGCEVEPSPAPIADWRDRVIYQIVTDRFANGDPSNDDADGVAPMPDDLRRVQGGDYRGILDHLDYIEHLGANAIWISPIVANVPRLEVGDGYHGYWASDFTTLNPRFGTPAELQTLIAAAHQRDIAVIVDIVPNHTGRVFDYDLDGDGVGDPDPARTPTYRIEPYEPVVFSFAPRLFTDAASETTLALTTQHFHRRGIGDLSIPEERRYGDFPEGLRDLDTERPEIEAALIETWVHWASVLDLDGFRIDAVPHVDRAFWPRFCTALRRRLAAEGISNFYLLGEVFETDLARLLPWLEEGSIDGTFDFPLKFDVIDGVILGGLPPSGARAALETNRARFRSEPQPDGIGLGPWQARIAFGDSHDVTRLRALLDDPFAVDQVLTLLFTVDAIPLVYYGTEQDLAGGGGHLGREPLWGVGYDETAPTYQLVRLLAALRRDSIALRRGALTVRFLSEVGGSALETDVADAGLIVYERSEGDAHALVALNTHPSHPSSVEVETALGEGTVIDRLSGDPFVVEGGRIILTVPPRSSVILLP